MSIFFSKEKQLYVIGSKNFVVVNFDGSTQVYVLREGKHFF